MLIVDASCLYEMVADGVASEQVRERLARDEDYAAPNVVDAKCWASCTGTTCLACSTRRLPGRLGRVAGLDCEIEVIGAA